MWSAWRFLSLLQRVSDLRSRWNPDPTPSTLANHSAATRPSTSSRYALSTAWGSGSSGRAHRRQGAAAAVAGCSAPPSGSGSRTPFRARSAGSAGTPRCERPHGSAPVLLVAQGLSTLLRRHHRSRRTRPGDRLQDARRHHLRGGDLVGRWQQSSQLTHGRRRRIQACFSCTNCTMLSSVSKFSISRSSSSTSMSNSFSM